MRSETTRFLMAMSLLMFTACLLIGCGDSSEDGPAKTVGVDGKTTEAHEESPAVEPSAVVEEPTATDKPAVGEGANTEAEARAAIEVLGGRFSENDTRLDLSRTQITDAGLEHLKGLTSLNRLILTDTQITDAGLEHLKELTSLTWLSLNGTLITDAGREELKKALPRCHIQ